MFAIVERDKAHSYKVQVFNKEEDATAFILKQIKTTLSKYSKQDQYVKKVLESIKKFDSKNAQCGLSEVIDHYNEFMYLGRHDSELALVEATAPLATKAMLRFLESRQLENLL